MTHRIVLRFHSAQTDKEDATQKEPIDGTDTTAEIPVLRTLLWKSRTLTLQTNAKTGVQEMLSATTSLGTKVQSVTIRATQRTPRCLLPYAISTVHAIQELQLAAVVALCFQTLLKQLKPIAEHI